MANPKPPRPALGEGPNRPARARIAAVIESRHYRDLMVSALRDALDLEVLDLGDGGAESIDLLLDLKPDVTILDVAPPRGLVIIRDLHLRSPELRLLAINLTDDEDQALRLFEAGLVGAVPRTGTFQDVITAVGSALRDEFQCPPKMALTLVKRLHRLGEGKRRVMPSSGLTRREEQVIRLVEQGLSNKAIAERLGIELSTVKNHVHNILAKLAATRRTDAVRRHRDAASHLRLVSRTRRGPTRTKV